MENRFEEAATAAERAHDLFAGIDLTYEAARASELLGRIHHAQGNMAGARVEESDALAAYEQIGAVVDAQRARGLLATQA